MVVHANPGTWDGDTGQNKTPRASHLLCKYSATELHLWPFTKYFKAKEIISKLKLLCSRKRAIGCV